MANNNFTWLRYLGGFLRILGWMSLLGLPALGLADGGKAALLFIAGGLVGAVLLFSAGVALETLRTIAMGVQELRLHKE